MSDMSETQDTMTKIMSHDHRSDRASMVVQTKVVWRYITCTCMLLMIYLFCLSSLAWAEWGYQVTQKVKPGQRVQFSMTPPNTLSKVKVTLTSPGVRRPMIKRFGKLRAGRPQIIKFKPPKGLSHWKVEVEGRSSQGHEQAVFEFDIRSVHPLKMSFIKQKSDLKIGQIVFKSNRPLGQVELRAYDDEGELQWDEVVEAKTRGRTQIVTFAPRDEISRRVDVKVQDSAGGWQVFKIVRWYAEVPHDDVLFVSGSAEVTQDELPKIQQAITAIQEEIEKFRRAMGDPDAQVDLRLYVAGYTDTVGDRQDNLRLSERRAQAIGHIFKRLGVTLSIYCAGFGEGGQLVRTEDAKEEARNRRALYVVANHPPSGIFFPRARWRSLR